MLDDGQEIEASNILSSAGLVETMRMCEDVSEVDESCTGRLSFCEMVSVLDTQPQDVGFTKTDRLF